MVRVDLRRLMDVSVGLFINKSVYYHYIDTKFFSQRMLRIFATGIDASDQYHIFWGEASKFFADNFSFFTRQEGSHVLLPCDPSKVIRMIVMLIAIYVVYLQ